MKIEFSKMHGLGNDFIVLDGVRQQLPAALSHPDTITRLADRRRGIGCDQLLLLENSADAQADFTYRIFNSDGGEVGQCLNGVRCAHVFLRRRGLSEKDMLALRTKTVLMQTTSIAEARVRVSLPRPRKNGDIVAEGIAFELWDAGNPHAVCLSGVPPDAEVRRIGEVLNRSTPGGVNVGFAAIDGAAIKLRVYERGAGMTEACGSGALAAATAAIEGGRAPDPVMVITPGGELRCGFAENRVAWLEGDIKHVYDGVFDWDEAK